MTFNLKIVFQLFCLISMKQMIELRLVHLKAKQK